MHAPLFWLFLIVILAFYLIRAMLRTYFAAQAAEEEATIQRQRIAAIEEEKAAKAADRASIRAARDAATATRRGKHASSTWTPPRFPTAAEQETCEQCADPAHLDCPGDADCTCCQRTAALVASAGHESAD